MLGRSGRPIWYGRSDFAAGDALFRGGSPNPPFPPGPPSRLPREAPRHPCPGATPRRLSRDCRPPDARRCPPSRAAVSAPPHPPSPVSAAEGSRAAHSGSPDLARRPHLTDVGVPLSPHNPSRVFLRRPRRGGPLSPKRPAPSSLGLHASRPLTPQAVHDALRERVDASWSFGFCWSSSSGSHARPEAASEVHQ